MICRTEMERDLPGDEAPRPDGDRENAVGVVEADRTAVGAQAAKETLVETKMEEPVKAGRREKEAKQIENGLMNIPTRNGGNRSDRNL